MKPVNHLVVKKVVCSSAALRSKRYKDTEKRKQTKDTEIRIKNQVQAQVNEMQVHLRTTSSTPSHKGEALKHSSLI